MKGLFKMKDVKDIPQEELQATVDKFKKDGKLNKTTLSLVWMDNYVAKFHPEKIDEWATKCALIPKKTRKKDGLAVKDVEAVRNIFIKDYFPDYTDDAIKDRKAADKAKKEAEKAEQERINNLPLEEQLKLRLQKLKVKEPKEE